MHASYSPIDLCKQIQIFDLRDSLMWIDKWLISIGQSVMCIIWIICITQFYIKNVYIISNLLVKIFEIKNLKSAIL